MPPLSRIGRHALCRIVGKGVRQSVRRQCPRAVFPVLQLLPIMSEGGAIVFVSSLGARAAVGTLAAYASTKGAINTLVKYFAAALGTRGIRVNAVAPGAIDTPMTAPMHGAAEIVESELAHIPLRRFGFVTEIAPTVAFLCTEQSSYTSGAIFVVDGASDCV